VTQPDTSHSTPTSGDGVRRASDSGHGDVRVRLFARTDVGQIREHNEDNFLVADLTRRSRGLLEANRSAVVGHHGALFSVCDGMGGAAAGEIASQLAVDIVYERMSEALDDSVPLHRNDLARRLVHAVEAAGMRIFQEAKLDRTRRGMGTTVTAAALVDDHLFLAQVGDSRGYVLRGDTLMQVTRDQSGQLTEEEAETFEHNNIILQALGTSDTVQVDLTYVHLCRGDVLLLCSDGLSGMVRFDEIREVLRSSSDPMEVCKTLTDRANQAGGHDNITVIVVHFDGDGLAPVKADGEPLKYRKYSLPEEPPENTEPNRRSSIQDGSVGPNAHGASLGPGSISYAPPTNPGDPGWAVQTSGGHSGSGEAAATGGWNDRPPSGAPESEERIDIPGTHVPAWIVVLLVIGVVALLAGTAFVLLR
jgi:PPM family protein phosphatase